MSSATTVVTNVPDELKSAAKSRRKNRNKKVSGNVPSPQPAESEWTSMSPKSLWKQIKEEAEAYFKFTLDSDNGIDNLCEVYGLQKVSLLRSICMKTGIQVWPISQFYSILVICQALLW